MQLESLMVKVSSECIKRHHHKQWVDGIQRKYWGHIQCEVDRILVLHRNTSHHPGLRGLKAYTFTFNKFLNCIIELGVGEDNGSTLRIIDEYYLSAKRAGILPDAVTFNILLKANRMSLDGVRGKLASVHLNEMIEYSIPADSYTIVELLAMCARSPGSKTMNGTMTNKQVADAEFDYYLKNIFTFQPSRLQRKKSKKKLPPAYVFNTYLDVYASDGDVDGMMRLLALARHHGIVGLQIDKEAQNTVMKGNEIAGMQRIGKLFECGFDNGKVIINV